MMSVYTTKIMDRSRVARKGASGAIALPEIFRVILEVFNCKKKHSDYFQSLSHFSLVPTDFLLPRTSSKRVNMDSVLKKKIIPKHILTNKLMIQLIYLLQTIGGCDYFLNKILNMKPNSKNINDTITNFIFKNYSIIKKKVQFTEKTVQNNLSYKYTLVNTIFELDYIKVIDDNQGPTLLLFNAFIKLICLGNIVAIMGDNLNHRLESEFFLTFYVFALAHRIEKLYGHTLQGGYPGNLALNSQPYL
ncbi:hypothetical protein AGLY_006402 [Aphis glycines]|uniref:Uncharacterized protein n=1 Tax=Aphis glycines TaxID=307491 RepID=A0A6G0TRU9_APHGL|nr:hypothetical protein AGLY_006402 [Aphis glycines]